MSTTQEAPKPAAPKPPAVNRLGIAQTEYKAADSTLCAGCGHDAITAQLIRAMFELGVDPYGVAKSSGIGCSSKTTTYFLGKSHGLAGCHGRAAAMATGMHLADRSLLQVCVSGDGDTASIGLGHFMHMVRRNMPVVYIIENNGVYGLTKGQFSATADKGSESRRGLANEMDPIDCCMLAIEMGCEYVARSFSGDMKQLVPLLKGAIVHGGTAVVDVVSPCITFNNHEGSTKSFKFAKEHEDPLHEVGFVPFFEQVKADYDPGTTSVVALPDGSEIRLKKLEWDYDPTDRNRALALLDKASRERLFLTGLIYHSATRSNPMADQLHMVDTPLAHLTQAQLRPGPEALAEVMESLR
jgi:2-oxoglutarate/2-oxoacid ferredoxin oxidoreductase subunit beta